MTFVPVRVLEDVGIVEKLKKLGIESRYLTAKHHVLAGTGATDIKIRQPKQHRIWSFRITRKYRALGVVDDDSVLIIYDIDDHQ